MEKESPRHISPRHSGLQVLSMGVCRLASLLSAGPGAMLRVRLSQEQPC